jgi:hypothetical protein
VQSLYGEIQLAPWVVNPWKLVSWWEMQQFSGRRLYWVGQWLERLRQDSLLNGCGMQNTPVDPHALLQPLSHDERKHTVLIMEEASVLEAIGLPISAETMLEIKQRIKEDSSNILTYEWLHSQIMALQKLMEKEMKKKFFIYITPEKVRYFGNINDHSAFGADIIKAFPSAEYDAWEASRCLGFMRDTAAVFHLMRVLEKGLTALGVVFSVSLAHTNWGPAIDQIESKIREMHKDPTWKAQPDCKEKQEFYAQVASHFGILKDAWRNFTMHGRAKYSEDQATQIYENTQSFMQKLVKGGLHE